MWNFNGNGLAIMEEQHITYQHSAPYYKLNSYTKKTKRIWIVFHGYGQLAKFFIRKFEHLDKDENYFIVPQGLHKYYLEGFYGRVGASWMTKEDRLNDIQNQYAYIDAVLENEPIDWENVELIYFGFSQGVATMTRYAAHAKRVFNQMIIWAGTFPPELQFEDFKYLTGSEKVKYFTGTQDPFLEEGMEEKQRIRVMEAMDIEPEVIWFEGKHEVIPDLLLTI